MTNFATCLPTNARSRFACGGACARARRSMPSRPRACRWRGRATWWWTSGGLTAAALAAATLLLLSPSARTPGIRGEATSADALDVLTDEVDPELYEDLDLYRWLAQEGNRA